MYAWYIAVYSTIKLLERHVNEITFVPKLIFKYLVFIIVIYEFLPSIVSLVFINKDSAMEALTIFKAPI